MLGDLFGVGVERYEDGIFRWNNCFNWMKVVIFYLDRVIMVLLSYVNEIKILEFGKGLD